MFAPFAADIRHRINSMQTSFLKVGGASKLHFALVLFVSNLRSSEQQEGFGEFGIYVRLIGKELILAPFM